MIKVLTGANHFLLQQELNQIIDEFTNAYGDLNLERLDGEEVSAERLMEAAHSLPFLADKKLIILRNPGIQKAFMERIDNVINDVPEGVEVVLVEPKIDRRSSYYKVLKARTELKEFMETDSNKLNTWIVQYVKEQDGQISSTDASYLIERVGSNQQLLHGELQKLLSFNSNISHANIDLLTELAPQSTIFELIDSAFAGNAKKTLELYHQQRALKVEPQQIIAMLAWQLHVLAVVKTAGDKSSEEIAKAAKLNPFVVRKTATLASRINLAEVKGLIKRALKLDTDLKSRSIDADEALQYFLLTIS
ncbi:MAG: DNA polymerase III subunit delta [Candidatus Saccharimonadales bacterium]